MKRQDTKYNVPHVMPVENLDLLGWPYRAFDARDLYCSSYRNMYLDAKKPGNLINPRGKRGKQVLHDGASIGDWDTMG
jgi:hypothetical protein